MKIETKDQILALDSLLKLLFKLNRSEMILVNETYRRFKLMIVYTGTDYQMGVVDKDTFEIHVLVIADSFPKAIKVSNDFRDFAVS